VLDEPARHQLPQVRGRAAQAQPIQFTAGDGRRKSIRLGKVSQRMAEEIKVKVEQLNAAAAIASMPLDAETARWVSGIGDELAQRLAAVGLIPRRRTTTLGQWLGDYLKHRADVSKGTSANYGIVANRLLAYFTADRPLHDITRAEADRWLVFLKQEYAGPTGSKSVKMARQFWSLAIRDGLASENPFAHLRTGLLRILRRAGVEPWPRLYQNLRSSRETELAETFPIHVVAEWLGNSPKTALAHYTQVTEDHFQRAAKSGAAGRRTVSHDSAQALVPCELVQEGATQCDLRQDEWMTLAGFEPQTCGSTVP
jgi:hypothetical protein